MIMTVIIGSISSMNKMIIKLMELNYTFAICYVILGFIFIQASIFMNYPQYESFLLFILCVICIILPINNLSNEMINSCVN